MLGTLLKLSLCVATFIQLTSSQSTYNVTQPDNDVSSYERTEQMFHQLMTTISELQQKCDACSGNESGCDKRRTKGRTRNHNGLTTHK